jgi:sialate O-acetylesterase
MKPSTSFLKRRHWLGLAAIISGFTLAGPAAVRLPKVFSDHMVLQQGKPLQVWGWAAAGEPVTVEIAGQKIVTTATAPGEWKATLVPLPAGGPHRLVVRGSNTVTFEDVLVGEVWLCSGQSNMEMGITQCDGADPAIAGAQRPQLRLLSVPNRWTPLPQTDLEATWRVCTPESIKEGGWGGFSACAYYFGRMLQDELKVPIGLIDATWGGTSIQSWTPPEGFAAVPELQKESELVRLGDVRTPEYAARLEHFLQAQERWLAEARAALRARTTVPAIPAFPEELKPPGQLQAATALFNGMIHPLCPYTLAGVIWYQGESNLSEGRFYGYRMHALIKGWREIWGQGDFPFNFVQIAPYNYGGRPESLPELWEGQAQALALPNTGMAVVNDISNLRDIHPRNKTDVGERLARIALQKTYGREQIAASGPVFRSLALEGNQLRVTFDHAEGLASRDGKPLTWFEVIDAERGGFVAAEAKIEGHTVVLTAAAAPRPVAVRYAWSMLAEPNLRNAAGLPASAFRAGAVPQRDSLEMTIPEARDYELVYDLDVSKVSKRIQYTTNRTAQITKPFDRIAYFLELQPKEGAAQYVYVSMNAFTSDARKIGVPTAESGAHFQQAVTNLNLHSNVKGLATGPSIATGNIEFWSGNYGPENAAQVPGASAQTLDFGDSPAPNPDGYGSMQVHHTAERQTIFALNHWSEGENADLGIGNNSSGNPDWTFARNAQKYASARLRILVRTQR